MAKILGKNYRLCLVAGSEKTPLVGESSSNLNLSADVIEVSGKDNDWKEYLAGMKGGTVDATLYADTEDAGQVTLINALMVGEVVECFYGEVTEETEAGYAFDAIVTSVGTSADIGGAVTRSVSLQITGAIQDI